MFVTKPSCMLVKSKVLHHAPSQKYSLFHARNSVTILELKTFFELIFVPGIVDKPVFGPLYFNKENH
jgi:hypothetical protein